jgi:hypothetical protein
MPPVKKFPADFANTYADIRRKISDDPRPFQSALSAGIFLDMVSSFSNILKLWKRLIIY